VNVDVNAELRGRSHNNSSPFLYSCGVSRKGSNRKSEDIRLAEIMDANQQAIDRARTKL
jgi:hypothetical protein